MTMPKPGLRGASILWMAGAAIWACTAEEQQRAGDLPLGGCDLAIEDVTVIDGTGSEARPGARVAVRAGRIVAITPANEGPECDRSVDGASGYLIPGLIDAHAHPFPYEESFPRFTRFGVTSIFVPGCSLCSDANLEAMRSHSERHADVSPRAFHTSQHFTLEGRHPVKTYPSDRWVDGVTVHYVTSPERIAERVRQVAQQPILGIKVTIENGPTPPFVERISVEQVREIVEQAHALELPVFAHVDDIEEVRIAEQAGVDHLLHFVGVDLDEERDGDMLRRLLARDPSWVTTLMVDKALLYPLHPEWMEVAREAGLVTAEELEGLKARRPPEAARELLQRLYGASDPSLDTILGPQLEDLRLLHSLGFDLVVGTDTANRFIFPGLSVHEEMELLATVFSPSEVLRMATRNAAEMLGQEDLGTLEVGKRADMVLLDADPLDDIRHTRRIRAVFRDGLEQRVEAPGTDDAP